MKKLFTITLFLMLTVCGFQAHAQISFIGTKDYGRIYDITFDPFVENKLYAVSQGNHIIYSLDKGLNWEILYSFPENEVFLKGLKYMNDHALSFFVDYSVTSNGIYVFDLDTETITQTYILPTPPNSEKDWVMSYSIFPGNTNIVLAHQSYMVDFVGYAKVYYTTDGGTNWQEVYYNVNNDYVFPNDVAISPVDPSKLFIARANGPTLVAGGLFISDNAGLSWTETLQDNTLGAITFHPSDPETLLVGSWIGTEGQVENLYRSTDNGVNWETLPVTWTDETLNCINKIIYNPSDYNNIVVLEENEIAITTDNGANWTNHVYSVDDPSAYTFGTSASFNPFQSDDIFINSDWYPMYSVNGGATLQPLPVEFYKSTFVGTSKGSEPHIYHSVQEGLVHTDGTSGTTQAFDIVPLNYISLGNAPVYYIDNYVTGRVFSFNETFSGSFLNVSSDHGQSKSSIYQTFFDFLLEVTTDPGNPNLIWTSFMDGGIIIFDITDLNNVQQTSIALPEGGQVTSIHLLGQNPDEVFITLNHLVYKSLDGGNTWSMISNGINLGSNEMLHELQRNPFNSDELVVSGSTGIFKSTDAGENWTQVYSGSNVRKLSYSTLTNGHLVATAHTSDIATGKIIYSTDGGNSWTEVPLQEIAHSGFYSSDHKFFENSADIYIASLDLGVLKYTLDLSSVNTPESRPTLQNVKVYPNPAVDIINVELNNETPYSLTLYSLTGAKVMEVFNLRSLDISSLESGIYFLGIKSNENNIIIKKILKK